MAYGVTSTGFKAKRYEEIFDDIKARFKTDLGIDLDRNPDMIAKVVSNIITLPIAQSWSNTQTLQSMFDVDKAEGVWLDNLASFYGITRSIGSYPRGRESITVSSPLTILADEEFSDGQGNTFLNDEPIIINEESATKITYTTPMDNPSLTSSTVLINGSSYTAIGTNPSNQGIVLIADAINADADIDVTAVVYDEEGLSVLEITTNTLFERHTFLSSADLTPSEITNYGEIRSDTLGDDSYVENSVTTFPSYAAILSTTNLEPIDDGAGEETDAELRLRIKSTRSTGKATLASIKAALLAVDNVNTAVVLENDTEVQDTINGIPPKAFKCIVKGGETKSIAEAIWDTKPAGIASSGEETYLVRDSEGDLQTVFFSRVEDKYIHVQVRYSLYDEEQAPDNVAAAISEQVLAFGETLDVGVDVIQGRIGAAIYQNVSGLERVIVRIGATDSPNDPTPALNDYIPIDILPSEESNFDANRIVVSPI